MENKVVLTRQEVNGLRNYTKEVGHGSDGRVFPYNKKYLIKLYRKSLTMDAIIDLDQKGPFKNDDDVKIYVMKKNRTEAEQEKYDSRKYRKDSAYITYYRKDDDNPEHDTKLAPSEAIKAAIKRQKDIKRTKLPLASVYYNNKFIGCIIEKLNGISIHKLMGLPMGIKRKIIENVIDDLEELMNNHVYHRDLSNSPFARVSYRDENDERIDELGHSHVLVNPFTLKTNIIDLDGKSTIYTERDNEELKDESIRELTVLILEYLLTIQLQDYEPVDFEYDNPYLLNLLNTYNCVDIEELVSNIFADMNSLDDTRRLVKTICTK